MNISIIIVNYNKYNDTIACVESLLNIQNIHFANIIIIDNCSTNNSYNILKKYFKNIKIILLCADENRGYCAGNNIGIRYAQQNINPNYYWILNPDTLVDNYALTKLIEFSENHTNAGIVGSKLIYYPEMNILQELGGGYIIKKKIGIISFYHCFNKVSTEKLLSEYIELDFVNGASFFIRKEVIEMIGFMDESYFMYSDEIEYCLRAKKNGWKLYGISSSIIWHKEGWRDIDQKCWSLYYITRNTLFLIQKYYKNYLYINIIFNIYKSLKLLFQIFLFKQKKIIMLLYIIKGIIDYFFQKRGKTIAN